jgi:hypothetical protein
MNMFGRLFISVAVFLCAVIIPADLVARELENYSIEASKSGGQIGFKIEKIDYRDDLTRVYGFLIGKPHTSGRIDEMIFVASTGEKLDATDIDGIDMKRWFQWEDDNAIYVEIDFPPMKIQSEFTIMLSGPKGPSKWTIIQSKK